MANVQGPRRETTLQKFLKNTSLDLDFDPRRETTLQEIIKKNSVESDNSSLGQQEFSGTGGKPNTSKNDNTTTPADRELPERIDTFHEDRKKYLQEESTRKEIKDAQQKSKGGYPPYFSGTGSGPYDRSDTEHKVVNPRGTARPQSYDAINGRDPLTGQPQVASDDSGTLSVASTGTMKRGSQNIIENPKQALILSYPANPEEFQKFFMKIEAYAVNIKDKNRDPYMIIYLPVPNGLLQENHSLLYSPEELGSVAEALKTENANLTKILGLEGTMNQIGRVLGESMSSFYDNLGNLPATWLEQQIQKTEDRSFQALRAGAGFARAPNFTNMFQGIGGPTRELILRWTFRPKNYEDATVLELILKKLQQASLPQLSDVSVVDEFKYALQELTPFVDETRPDETLQEQSDVTKKKEYDHKLYSSTYRAPHEFKFTVCERVGKEMSEVTHLINFPFPFMTDSFSSILGGADADTFVKHTDQFSGDNEYFFTSYDVTWMVREQKQFNSTHVVKYESV